MELNREEKLACLEKVLASRAMQGSESLKTFLRFIATKSLDDPDAQFKEHVIAKEVFGRKTNFDPRNDSVVRVQAGRLRSKLQEYYATEGKGDKILVDLPKGHYTPVFSYAPNFIASNGSEVSANFAPALAVTDTLSPESSLPSSADAGEKTGRQSGLRVKWSIVGLAAVLFAFVLLAFYYQSEASRLRESMAGRPPESLKGQAPPPFWSDFLRSPEPVLVTFSNVLFSGTAETGMKLLKPLDTPVPSVGSPALNQPDKNASVLTEHYTGIGEAMGVFFLGDFFNRAGRPVRVKRSLLLTWDDLKTGNIVFLGSPAENYLLRDLPQKQDFLFQVMKDENQQTVFGIVNTNPTANEQRVYVAKQEGPSRSQISEDYALISLLKGLESDRRLLILAGITTFGTQAAAEYVTKPEYVEEIISRMNTSGNAKAPSLPSFYQILIKVKVNGGVPVQLSYVTHHVLQ